MDSNEKEAMASDTPPVSYNSVDTTNTTGDAPQSPQLFEPGADEPLESDTVKIEVEEEGGKKKEFVSPIKKADIPCLIFALIFYSAIPITMVVLGVLNFDECPLNENIPVFLIVTGCWTMLLPYIVIMRTCVGRNMDGENCCNKIHEIGIKFKNVDRQFEWKHVYAVDIMYLAFFFVWLALEIWGSVIVFREWSSWEDFNLIGTCDNTTYLFSFSMLIIFWVLSPVFGYIASMS